MYLILKNYWDNSAISALLPQTGLPSRFATPFSMYQIRRFFMVLHSNIIFDIIGEKGR